MRDFTPQALELLFVTLKKDGCQFITFSDYLSGDITQKFVIIRHDIDRKYYRALRIAKMENDLGIKASYYFRCINYLFPNEIIYKINGLGHEIGYHYEVLVKANGNYTKAIEVFNKELALLRKITDVKTISSHGSPLSKWDSRRIWQNENFKEFGLLGDCNLSINNGQIFYLTDTGRGWNTKGANIRDKVNPDYSLSFKNTFDLIEAINNDRLPAKLMINIHPQRWNEGFLPWLNELVWGNIKNIGKRILVRIYR